MVVVPAAKVSRSTRVGVVSAIMFVPSPIRTAPVVPTLGYVGVDPANLAPSLIRIVPVGDAAVPIINPVAALMIPSVWSNDPPTCSPPARSEEHTSELQSQSNLVCRLLLEKKKSRLRVTVCNG